MIPNDTKITGKDTERNVIYDMTQVVIQVKDINDNKPTINTTILPPASRDVSDDEFSVLAFIYF